MWFLLPDQKCQSTRPNGNGSREEQLRKSPGSLTCHQAIRGLSAFSLGSIQTHPALLGSQRGRQNDLCTSARLPTPPSNPPVASCHELTKDLQGPGNLSLISPASCASVPLRTDSSASSSPPPSPLFVLLCARAQVGAVLSVLECTQFRLPDPWIEKSRPAPTL